MPGKQGSSLLPYTTMLPLCSYQAIYTIVHRRRRQFEAPNGSIGYSNLEMKERAFGAPLN